MKWFLSDIKSCVFLTLCISSYIFHFDFFNINLYTAITDSSSFLKVPFLFQSTNPRSVDRFKIICCPDSIVIKACSLPVFLFKWLRTYHKLNWLKYHPASDHIAEKNVAPINDPFSGKFEGRYRWLPFNSHRGIPLRNI